MSEATGDGGRRAESTADLSMTQNPKSKIQNPKSVTVVIPTYNSIGLLRSCLDSLRDQDYPRDKLHIVVVDNASSDGTAETLRLHYPHVALSVQEENTGFARACNRGAALADTEYVAFLNDDALADRSWLRSLFAGLEAGGEGAVCAASQIRSRDGKSVEYEGASSNLFGAGRPMSVWGWPDMPEPPGEGSAVLFASGGAMLIHRETFLDIGGFDPEYFAYFEDVDLGWRLWALGHKVVYAAHAVVRHIGGATGSRSPIHRRYTLWECNSLATILKNYEAGNMERILSAALMLQYRRALMSSGDVVHKEAYALTGPPDTNATNVEHLPRVSVAHLAAIDRLNSIVPHLMRERRRIQSARVRSDAEILPLLGHAWQPQFAGSEYANAARKLASDFGLYSIIGKGAPNRVLILASSQEEERAATLAKELGTGLLIALVCVGADAQARTLMTRESFTLHRLRQDDPLLGQLVHQADALIAFPGFSHMEVLRDAIAPVALIGKGRDSTPLMSSPSLVVEEEGDPRLLAFCMDPKPDNSN